jgi:hypothetical protein
VLFRLYCYRSDTVKHHAFLFTFYLTTLLLQNISLSVEMKIIINELEKMRKEVEAT